MTNLIPNNRPFKCPSQGISAISFNAQDTCMVVISNDGFVYRYDMITFTQAKDGTIDRNCDFKACLFLPDPLDDFKILAVGSDAQRAMFKVYNQNEDLVTNVVCS